MIVFPPHYYEEKVGAKVFMILSGDEFFDCYFSKCWFFVARFLNWEYKIVFSYFGSKESLMFSLSFVHPSKEIVDEEWSKSFYLDRENGGRYSSSFFTVGDPVKTG